MSKPLRTWVHNIVSNGTDENPLSASPLCSLLNQEGISVAKSGVFAPTSVLCHWDAP